MTHTHTDVIIAAADKKNLIILESANEKITATVTAQKIE